ncbi:MAG: nucleoside deaminase [Alphaproteobacteria bacterium]|nr:nucleoside deaminase [Alphaproteobacteria bacterium]
MSETSRLLSRLLDVIENDIAPLTEREVARGNKIFGAAILLKSDLSVVIAETNNEIENPLWHGEMHAIKRLYERDRSKIPNAADCIFLATHEPCSLCLSAITWAGYDNFYYLFSHEDSRDSFAIPHDLKILKEVFGLSPGGYKKQNEFWRAHAIVSEIDALDPAAAHPLNEQITRIGATYEQLSSMYQDQKGGAGIPLA